MSVAEGLVTTLGGINGLRVFEEWPDTVSMDAVIVNGPITMDDLDMAACRTSRQYEITLLMSLGGGQARAHRRLAEFLEPSGAQSVKATLEANPTLNGQVDMFIWRGIRDQPSLIAIPRVGSAGNVQTFDAYGATILIEVYG